MPDEKFDNKPEIKIKATPPDPPEIPKRRPKRKRTFTFDKDRLVNYIVQTHNEARGEREERIQRNKERRAKLMGWLPGKDWPWPGSANFWIGIMLIADLKRGGP